MRNQILNTACIGIAIAFTGVQILNASDACIEALPIPLCKRGLGADSQEFTCRTTMDLLDASMVSPPSSTGHLLEVVLLSDEIVNDLLYGAFCDCLLEGCGGDILVLVVASLAAGHHVTADMHDQLVEISLDRSVDGSRRILATDLALADSGESIEWAFELLDPQQEIPLWDLRPLLKRLDDDAELMRMAIPHLLLRTPNSISSYERIEAKAAILRNKDVIDFGSLLPLMIVAAEECRPSVLPVRELALELAGAQKDELQRMFEILCKQDPAAETESEF